MGKLFSYIWHDPVWSKVISWMIIAVLGFVATVGWNWLGGGKSMQKSLKLVFEYKVNIWLVLAILVLLLIVRGFIIRNKQNNNRVPNPPFVNDFTEGCYQGQRWKWRWQWTKTYKFYYIADLNIVCPVCHDGLLTITYMDYKCGKCGADIPYNMLNANAEAVEKQIMEDARRQYNYCAEYIGQMPQPIVKG